MQGGQSVSDFHTPPPHSSLAVTMNLGKLFNSNIERQKYNLLE